MAEQGLEIKNKNKRDRIYLELQETGNAPCPLQDTAHKEQAQYNG